MPVVTQSDSIFFEPEYRDCEKFPPYTAAGTAILSYDVVDWLADTSIPLRPLRNWDAALGVWLSSLSALRPQWENTIFTLRTDNQQKFNDHPLAYSILNDLSKDLWESAWSSLKAAATRDKLI
jgi:hypothetical protein